MIKEIKSCSSDETAPLLSSLSPPSVPATESVNDDSSPYLIKTYKRRWYILLVFSFLSCHQALVWATWSTFSDSAKHVFGWNDASIAMLADWGNIPYVLMVIPICWILNTKGLRTGALLSSTLTLIGTGMRCISSNPAVAAPLIHIGQFLSGTAGVVMTGAPSQLSAVWFPAKERTTATSINFFMNSAGVSFAYFFGPLWVDEPRYISNNSSILNCSDHCIPINLDLMRRQIMRVMYGEFIVSGIFFLCITCYFPRKPPRPPAASAIVERLNLKTTFLILSRNSNFWVIALAYAMASAICMNWLAVIGPVLEPLGINQTQAGQLGAYSIMAGSVSSVILARLIDYLGGHIKMCLLFLWCLGGLSFIWYALICLGIIHSYFSYIAVIVLVIGILAYSGSPLYMELTSEVTYPVPEEVVGVCLQTITNVAGTIFLALFLIPHIGKAWLNWVLIGSSVIGIILTLLQKESYRRSDIDRLSQGVRRLSPPGMVA